MNGIVVLMGLIGVAIGVFCIKKADNELKNS